MSLADLHTFYVVTGGIPVLVHNCANPTEKDLFEAATGNAEGQLPPAGRALQKHGDPSPGNILKRGAAHVANYDFGKVTNSQRTEIAEEMILELLSNPSSTDTLSAASAHYGGLTRDIFMPDAPNGGPKGWGLGGVCGRMCLPSRVFCRMKL